ncbi:hypothetical protein BC629DRAFT_1505008 [Irpex lacteus]|nr:hypothetical protein BC629DRAFT_1505008 [Irpex lacteus]
MVTNRRSAYSMYNTHATPRALILAMYIVLKYFSNGLGWLRQYEVPKYILGCMS